MARPLCLSCAGGHAVASRRLSRGAGRAVASYERGFELGRYALFELTAAQERLVALKRDAVNAAASFQLAMIEIEGLLGNTNPGGMLL